MLYSLVQHPNGKTNSLPEAVAAAMQIDWSRLKDQLGEPWEHDIPEMLSKLDSFPSTFHPRRKDVKEAVEELTRQLIVQIILQQNLKQSNSKKILRR